MKLNVSERVVLLGLLPKEANYLTAKAIKELSEQLSLSSSEQRKYLTEAIQNDQTIITVNSEGLKKIKDVRISPLAYSEIVKILKDKNDNNKLMIQEISIYEKFVESMLKGDKNEK